MVVNNIRLVYYAGGQNTGVRRGWRTTVDIYCPICSILVITKGRTLSKNHIKRRHYSRVYVGKDRYFLFCSQPCEDLYAINPLPYENVY